MNRPVDGSTVELTKIVVMLNYLVFSINALLRECVAVHFTLNIKQNKILMETIHKNVYNLCSYDIEK